MCSERSAAGERSILTIRSGPPRASNRETLVLVPGLLCDDAVWSHQIEALGRRYLVQVTNLSDCTSISTMAKRILDYAPATFSIAGHSMGARVALEVVGVAPERVRRLALLDTGVHPPQEGETEKRHRLLKIAEEGGMRAMAELWLPPMVREGALDADESLRRELFAMVERMSPEIHRNQIEALLGRPDARPVLAAISCPVLVGVGAHDAWSPPSQHEEIAAAIPHADYVVFPDSGHMAPMEAPAAVTAALLEWMSKEVE